MTSCCFIEYNNFTKPVKVVKIMKHNYTKKQYEQLAREQFCRSLNEIPFVSDVEIISTGMQKGFGDFRAIVHFTDEEPPVNFWIKVKSNGEKRYVNEFMIMAAQHGGSKDCYVFMAPYISEESAVAIESQGYSYMDLSGNCYILTRRIILYVRGLANKYIEKREKRNYFSKTSSAASAIMRTMLDEPRREWQVKSLAEQTGKAIGMVSNVKRFLQDRAWIEEGEQGYHLCSIREMLYAWARDYHEKEARAYEYYSLDPLPQLEQRISEWSENHDESALLGGFSAAARYAPTVRYKKAEVYVEQGFLNEFVKDLQLEPVQSGGNIVITVPHDETPCMFGRKIHDDLVTSPVQTVIDLLGKPGRGEEAAETIITKEYER